MGGALSTAKKCFLENISLFGDPKTQPEKFNLYNGLANLVDALAEIQSQIARLDSQVQKIQQTMDR